MPLIDTFSKLASPFSYGGITHQVYWKKAFYPSNRLPAILLMHELPGMTESCLTFTNRLVDNGFTVYLPLYLEKLVSHLRSQLLLLTL